MERVAGLGSVALAAVRAPWREVIETRAGGPVDPLTLPITFQPTRIIPGSNPPRLESITSISCWLKECKVESPLLTDNFSIVEPDTDKPVTPSKSYEVIMKTASLFLTAIVSTLLTSSA